MSLSEEDVIAFRDSLRGFLSEFGQQDTIRKAMAGGGHDDAVWQACRTRLGLDTLTIPEEFGGQGFALGEAVVALEELGTHLALPALLAHLLAIEALKPQDGAGEMLTRLADGALATLAVSERDAGLDPDAFMVRCVQAGGSWTVTGEKLFVPLGCEASVLLVAARDEEGLRLLAVDGAAVCVTRSAMKAIDETRPLAKLDFAAAPATDLGAIDRAGFEAILDSAAILYAAEQLGVMRRCLEMSVAYAKERVQFGRPIGSFQAIKHKCAEMFRKTELAGAAVRKAAAAGPDERLELASIAKAYASVHGFEVAMETIQVHGGIGFTWEHGAHLYYKRAKTNEVSFGDAAFHHRRLAGPLGLL